MEVVLAQKIVLIPPGCAEVETAKAQTLRLVNEEGNFVSSKSDVERIKITQVGEENMNLDWFRLNCVAVVVIGAGDQRIFILKSLELEAVRTIYSRVQKLTTKVIQRNPASGQSWKFVRS